MQKKFSLWNALRAAPAGLWGDVRYALRIMLRDPVFAAMAVLILALGIGANSAIFSYINGTLLNPVPGVADTKGLVCLSQDSEEDGDVSFLDYEDLRDGNRSLSGLAAYGLRPMYLSGDSPVRIWGTLVSANYFDVLKAKPAMGRAFAPAEGRVSGSAPLAVISHALWQSYFQSARSVIGKKALINQHPYTIVGVMPPGFQGSQTGIRSDVWIPATMARQIIAGKDRIVERGDTWLSLIGRLKPGVSREQAQSELTLLIRRIAEQYPESHVLRPRITVSPLWRVSGINAYLYVLLSLLMGTAVIVLLLACINVAILLVVRLVGRRSEIATRLAIGANRWQLVRQLLVESVLLSVAGGFLAMLTSIWSARVFAGLIPPTSVPVSLNIRADSTVFLVTLGISLLTGVLFGVIPALRSVRIAPVDVLKEGSAGSGGGFRKARTLKVLVVAQISLSLVLLISAGLLIRSFWQAQRYDPGFNPDHVALASFDLSSTGYSRERGAEFYRQLLVRLRAIPGVQSATLSNWVPLGFRERRVPILPEGYTPRPTESMETGSALVGPDYFRTMQIPLISGRGFTSQDVAGGQPVAIVNQVLAERYWGREEIVGRRIQADSTWYTIVGVARNSRYFRLNEKPQSFLYLPLLQKYYPAVVIHARTSLDPNAAAPALEQAVHALNANLALYDLTTLVARIQIASAGQRIAATLVGAFGLLTLVLAAAGMYAVIAYSTRRRTHEIGIRMSLGAQGQDVFRLVLGQGFRLLAVGVTIGLGAALAVTRFLRTLLFGVTPTDALTFWGVPAVLCIVVLAACWIPARRAVRVNPITALRYQ
jgi:predicted permease